MQNALTDNYRNIGLSTGTGMVDADPYKLIQMLYQGLLDKLAKSKGYIARNDIEGRNNTINRCIEIIDCLRTSLDHDASSTLTANLENLYNYMEERLFIANANNDHSGIDEVAKLVITVKSGWDNIPEQERNPARSAVH